MNKEGVSIKVVTIKKIARRYGVKVDISKNRDYPQITFKKEPEIVISTVKEILDKAYINGAFLNLNKRDLKEIKWNIAPAKTVFFMPKKCKIDTTILSQITYKDKGFYKIENGLFKYKNTASNLWYAVPNSNRIGFVNRCPKIEILR